MKAAKQLVFLLVLGLFFNMGFLSDMGLASENNLNEIQRLYGKNRYETMYQVALELNSGKVSDVVLASGLTFPDALAGVPFAHQKKAPILLVDKTPANSQQAFTYIEEHLRTDGNVYILGGEAAIPDSFITALVAAGIAEENIQRIRGANRYLTALEIAKNMNHDGREFYIASGDKFPDALSASVLAATTNYITEDKAACLQAHNQSAEVDRGGVPILLVPSQGAIPEEIINYLNNTGFNGIGPDGTGSKGMNMEQKIHIVGGPAVVPEQSRIQLRNKVNCLAPNGIERIAGQNRYATMKKLNSSGNKFDKSWQYDGEGTPVPQVFLANGQNYPDALAGAVLAAQKQAPIVLLEDNLPSETTELLLEYYNRNQECTGFGGTNLTVLGGTGVISKESVLKADYLYNYGKLPYGKLRVSVLAGSGIRGAQNARGTEASFCFPSDIVQREDGSFLVSDTRNHLIRLISPQGDVSAFAGIIKERDNYGMPVGGYIEGDRTSAMFDNPKGLDFDSEGNLYIADSGNNALRVIDSHGQVTTLIDNLKNPSDVVISSDGTIYVSDTMNHRILEISLRGEANTLAGGGYEEVDGWLNGGFRDGKGKNAQFNEPAGLALGKDGLLYVADSGNQRIRSIAPDGTVRTVAGAGWEKIGGTTYLKGGFQDGAADEARFNFPKGLTAAEDGTVYLADTYNHSLRKITPSGAVETLAGSGNYGKQNGYLEQAEFDTPISLIIDRNGELLVVDQGNHSIRTIDL